MIIAIDGPAAAGKGTLAKKLAETLQCAYLDTGALYRAVGLTMIRKNMDPDDTEKAAVTAANMTVSDFAAIIKDPDLRKEIGAKAAAKVAKNLEVRKALLKFQRDFAENPTFADGNKAKGSILDGRDIGTVVCPNADIKFFVTASPEKRAERRYKEYKEKNAAITFEEVLKDVKERDEADRTRSASPLVPADDAIVLDTSSLTIDEVYEKALTIIAKNGKGNAD